MIGVVLDFVGLSQHQIDETIVVFAGLKSCQFHHVQLPAQLPAAPMDQLPDANDLRAAVLPWGSPWLAIVLAMLNHRSNETRLVELLTTGPKLICQLGDELWSFHLIPRFTAFALVPYTEERAQFDSMLLGEWHPEREHFPGGFEPLEGKVETILWEPSEATHLLDRLTTHGTLVYGELPGGWWAKPEFGEKVEGLEALARTLPQPKLQLPST